MEELNDLEKLIIDQLVRKDKNEEYVLDEDINNLELSPKKLEAVEKYLKEKNIGHYVETKNERSHRVGDSEFGQHESYGQSAYDKKVSSKVDYEGEQKISEDYSELDKKLKTFVRDNIKEIDNKGEPYLSIPLHKILALKLSEDEYVHVFSYLDKLDITVRGQGQNFDEFDNYQYITTYHYKDKPQYLTVQENYDLYEKYENETDPAVKQELRDELVIRNKGLAELIARKQIAKIPKMVAFTYDDLVQVGWQAIDKFVDDYDPSKGAFSTYMWYKIRAAVNREIQDMIPYSVNMYEKIGKLRKMRMALAEALKRQPTDEELVEALNIDMEELYEMKKCYKMNFPEEYDEDLVIADAVETEVLTAELRKAVVDYLMTANLKENELEVIIKRFGLDGGEPMTYKDIAKEKNVTGTWISTVAGRALKKLRRNRHFERRLKDYIYHDSEIVIEPSEKDEEFFDKEDKQYNGEDKKSSSK